MAHWEAIYKPKLCLYREDISSHPDAGGVADFRRHYGGVMDVCRREAALPKTP